MKLGALRKLAQAAPPLKGEQLQSWLQEQLRSMGLDPNALYQELEMTSPYVDTHRDVSHTNTYAQLHSHTFYELIFCCNNCGAEYLLESERYRLREGDIIFIPPGISHRPLLPEQITQPYNRYVLWLSEAFVEQYMQLYSYPLAQMQTRPSLLRTDEATWKQLGELFYNGVQEAERTCDGWEAAVVGNTMLLLTQIKRATDTRSAQPMKAEKPELLDRITAYIEKHYAQHITVGELSRHFFVSSSTISHLFKQRLGVSVCRYITQRRLIAAKTGIEKGQLLETVATQTGFADYSGFYRAFKQEYGISPRQYRNLQE